MGSVIGPFLPRGPEQHAPGEAVAHGDAIAFDGALAGRLGQLAAMNDGETVADAAGLVDGEIVVARPDDEARTSGRRRHPRPSPASDASPPDLRRRQKLLFVNRCSGCEPDEEPPPKMLVPRPEVTDERPHPESATASAAPRPRHLSAPPYLMTDCTVTLQSA